MLKLLFLWPRKRCRTAVLGLILSCALPGLVMGQPQTVLTLENSIRRTVEIAPETQAAEAMVRARQGAVQQAVQQAGAWPNPEIELRVDDQLGKDDGTGGNELTQFAFSQLLPVSGRLGNQKAIAGAELEAARAERRYQRLLLESQVAQRYHKLQLATDRLSLAEQRLQLIELVGPDGGAFKEAAMGYKRKSIKSRVAKVKLPIPGELTEISLIRVIHHDDRSHLSDPVPSLWRDINTSK